MPYKTIDFPGFGGGSAPAISTRFSARRAINLIPEKIDGGKWGQVGRPGLSAAAFHTSASSTCRQGGLYAGDNRLFAAIGDKFFEISTAGGIITNFGGMAGSTGLSGVQIAANGTQLLCMDRSAGQIFEATGGAMVARFAGIALEYLDGFFIAIDAAGGNLIRVSDLLNGAVWNALNVAQRTGASDALNGLAVLNGQLWIFGQKMTEVWYNAGNPLFPFARIPNATLNFGLLAQFSVAKFENCIMWLSGDSNGFAQVMMSEGLQAKKVSTPAIENAINGITKAAPAGNIVLLPYASAHAHTENGHEFYVLTIMSVAYTPTAQYVYDRTTGEWHERTYAGPWPISYVNVPGLGFTVTGPSIVGAGNSGKLYFQGNGYPSDGGTAITYTGVTPAIADGKIMKHSVLEIKADIGAAQITLEASNDGGGTFPIARSAISGSPETGQGFSARFRWRQLGRSRNRAYRYTISSSTELVRIAGASIGVEPGSEE